MTVHYLPTPTPAVAVMMAAIQKTPGFDTHPVHVYYEAQEWVRHGFTPEEAAEWVTQGYDGLAHIAQKLRNFGLSPRQGGCALADLEYLLQPGYGWEEQDRFLRRARHYTSCCMGPP